MNNTSPATFVSEMLRDLNAHVALCEDVLSLLSRENQALASSDYQPAPFHEGRKDLIPRLNQSLNCIRHWRQVWQRIAPAERTAQLEVKKMFQAVQDLLVKILLLDRENQQALLRHGLLPPRGVPSFAGQQPDYVSSVYRRHTVS
jgi:hypothetical protein